jgi:hypothetical protein
MNYKNCIIILPILFSLLFSSCATKPYTQADYDEGVEVSYGESVAGNYIIPGYAQYESGALLRGLLCTVGVLAPLAYISYDSEVNNIDNSEFNLKHSALTIGAGIIYILQIMDGQRIARTRLEQYRVFDLQAEERERQEEEEQRQIAELERQEQNQQERLAMLELRESFLNEHPEFTDQEPTMPEEMANSILVLREGVLDLRERTVGSYFVDVTFIAKEALDGTITTAIFADSNLRGNEYTQEILLVNDNGALSLLTIKLVYLGDTTFFESGRIQNYRNGGNDTFRTFEEKIILLRLINKITISK